MDLISIFFIVLVFFIAFIIFLYLYYSKKYYYKKPDKKDNVENINSKSPFHDNPDPCDDCTVCGMGCGH